MKESDLFSLLEPVLPDKVFPYVAPQDEPNIQPPWCIFSHYDVTGDVLCGRAETMTNIQIDVYAKTIDEARQIRDQAIAALIPLSPESFTEKQGYETDTALFRATLECQVWQ
ncbi:DUF3168 domain-containing protein [Morganella morganii]|uniref:tail completion protein gp17 n=1 Tax=Morganella morganii TaxID=582 RepID=UPI000D1F9C77|nr:DUF3168 domain-containing protein [Morganella morganii]QXO42229.1 DUF3168 domain-containing protein [Morganella morganii]QXO45861.1 DUF3168 domain-containing protein [Morganella morganii]QXO49532.1 DUF3168 domain-containing protein [Morganella morganii]QXO53393.1 DUF3168 domain-containing protein [Morganella morganii]QXO80032.1 DUF3168 domain-containing protein [Morganella morganii]